ncbi:hypothetical protein [Treponema sp.]|uniref:hypothetical protein n=1 Tax=Treponema sp. TaxID=166 RepID=UPI00388E13B3
MKKMVNLYIEKDPDVPEMMTGVERIAGISATDVETGDDVELKGMESFNFTEIDPNVEDFENDVRNAIEQNNPDLEINDINFSGDEVNF